MTRRSMKGTVPLSTIKLSSGEQYSDVKQFRNTRLHFYYNIPTAATNQTYFLVDNQAAYLQIIDCTATDMFNVRLGKNTKRGRSFAWHQQMKQFVKEEGQRNIISLRFTTLGHRKCVGVFCFMYSKWIVVL